MFIELVPDRDIWATVALAPVWKDVAPPANWIAPAPASAAEIVFAGPANVMTPSLALTVPWLLNEAAIVLAPPAVFWNRPWLVNDEPALAPSEMPLASVRFHTPVDRLLSVALPPAMASPSVTAPLFSVIVALLVTPPVPPIVMP